MNQVVEVNLWGTCIGYLGYAPNQTGVATFEYSDALLNSPIEISPIKLPNRQRLHAFPDDSPRTFKGLPGIFADSLPDAFGTRLIDIYMANRGVPEADVTALDRLLYIGDRAMGAIEYQPSVKFSNADAGIALDLQQLSELAALYLNQKDLLARNLKRADSHDQALRFIRVGSSAGGARAKALVAKTPQGELLDGTFDQGIDCSYWLLKFDSEGNQDRDNKDPKGMTKVEFIYSLIARQCEIDLPKTDFIELGDDFHFLIERFDRYFRSGKLDKRHYASWCGLAHAHRDATGAYSYEQLILLARQLGLGQDSITELFRRAVFNIVGRNQDDHTKNFGFLMDRNGRWSLAPGFDMTYSYDPLGSWTRTHQIKLNNKQDNFLLSDLIEFGRYCNLKEKQSKEIVKNTRYAFERFSELAQTYALPKDLTMTIAESIRTF